MQDCVAGLPGPFPLERGMSLVSCSFHTSGPRAAVPAPCKYPCLLCAHHGLPVPATPINTEALDQRLVPEGAPVNAMNPQWEPGSRALYDAGDKLHFHPSPFQFPPPHTPTLGESMAFCPEGRHLGGHLAPLAIYSRASEVSLAPFSSSSSFSWHRAPS